MIRLEHFTKNYSSKKNKKPAVENISFTAESNGATGLLGLNGAGKTTILRAVCALHYPTDGDIFVSDNENNCINTKEQPGLIKQMVGYIPEQPLFYTDFTVFEFLKFAYGVYGGATACMHGNSMYTGSLDRAVAECGLETVMQKKIGVLSKGYKQRISFARVLIQNPPVILLDEPSDGLDPAQIYKMKNFIIRLAKEKTILFSTHNIEEAKELCSKICIISGGKLAAEGTARELIERVNAQNLEEAFLKITGSVLPQTHE